MVATRNILSFEELKCWKAFRVVRQNTMGIIKKFPKEEKYALVDGMCRSSRSTTENIAEGLGRYHFSENIQFCRISRGSLFELIDQYIAAHDDKYLTNEELEHGKQIISIALILLNGYIKYLQKAKSEMTLNSTYKLKEDFFIYKTLADENNEI